MAEQSEPQTVLFFGKTGDGKSTLCNMLLFSKLEGEFQTGTDIGSVTHDVATKTHNNWTVIDTVGLGEAVKDSKHASKAALSKLTSFLAKEHMAVDHLCYVMRKGEFTKYERVYWQIFNDMFGTNDRKGHIRLIFTSASEKWLKDNEDAIKDLIGTYPMIAVDFPPKSNDEYEELLSKKRTANLDRLRKFLSKEKGRTPDPVRIDDGASPHGQDQSNEEANSPGDISPRRSDDGPGKRSSDKTKKKTGRKKT